MITFVDAAKESIKDAERCLDPQLWHACAGGMVQMPAVHSLVYYFPQGHAEHAQGVVEFGYSLQTPPFILCRVAGVKFMADTDTDEVFAKIRLIPVRLDEPDYAANEGGLGSNGVGSQEKLASFAKTLTQSDANNGGGFSVPRYCAESIFPRLDYSADPPVQTVHAKDVHGVVWKFRHIYRGTPRRHLLTTGWSTFVNRKKLVAGDSIVFMRTESGDLCVGIRRAKRGFGGAAEPLAGCNSASGNGLPTYGSGSFSMFLKEEDSSLMKGGMTTGSFMRGRGKVKPEDVVDAARLAVSGQPFEIVYYPRASTPEFCVKAASVQAAIRIKWWPGMRFKMAFETEDSSRISWFMGTISLVQVADPVRWPNSPWRLLQVTWDEPDLLQNVKRVNPWLVELISSMPAIHLASFSPPRKKLCIPSHPELPLEVQLPTPVFHGNPLARSSPASLQGARQTQFGICLPDFHFHKLQPSLSYAGIPRLDHVNTRPRIPDSLLTRNPSKHEDVSCWLSIGTPHDSKKASNINPPQLVLFGKLILTEQQISSSNSRTVSAGDNTNSSSDENADKMGNASDLSGSPTNKRSIHSISHEKFSLYKDCSMAACAMESGQCKVFMESEDIGRILDLSIFGSYDELYFKLAEIFGIGKDELMQRVLYRNAEGTLKHTGDEPFSEFLKTARRLTILADSRSVDFITTS